MTVVTRIVDNREIPRSIEDVHFIVVSQNAIHAGLPGHWTIYMHIHTYIHAYIYIYI